MFPLNDALDAILLGMFLFGLIFTVLSLILGFVDIGGHGDGAGHGDHGIDVHGDSGLGELVGGALSVSGILAFVTWFGGIGYLVRNGIGWIAPVAIVFGAIGGFVAAMVVSWFLVKVLRPASTELDPKEYQTIGAIGRVTSSIREGGTGEIVYELGGTRQVSAARSMSGTAIPRGAEVAVMRVTHGIAEVDTLANLLEERYPDA
jgi:membrane protein implicated in regulation of membrane protease activity